MKKLITANLQEFLVEFRSEFQSEMKQTSTNLCKHKFYLLMIVVGVSIVEDSTKLEFEVVASTDESAKIESNLILSHKAKLF